MTLSFVEADEYVPGALALQMIRTNANMVKLKNEVFMI
jgi:hypothetical protein